MVCRSAPTRPGHAILAGLEDAPRIVKGVQRVDVGPRGECIDPPVTLIPVYPDLPMEQKVEVRLPAGAKARMVQFLVAGGTPQTSESNGKLTLTVPSILEHEVVAIDL